LLLKRKPGLLEALGLENADVAALTVEGLSANLVPVTLGNIVGGTLLVAGVYWFAYLRPKGDPEGEAN
jgi:formate/nitrite transporter FocA (FNT family)